MAPKLYDPDDGAEGRRSVAVEVVENAFLCAAMARRLMLKAGQAFTLLDVLAGHAGKMPLVLSPLETHALKNALAGVQECVLTLDAAIPFLNTLARRAYKPAEPEGPPAPPKKGE